MTPKLIFIQPTNKSVSNGPTGSRTSHETCHFSVFLPTSLSGCSEGEAILSRVPPPASGLPSPRQRLLRSPPPTRHRVPGSSTNQLTRTQKPAGARINNGHLPLSPAPKHTRLATSADSIHPTSLAVLPDLACLS